MRRRSVLGAAAALLAGAVHAQTFQTYTGAGAAASPPPPPPPPGSPELDFSKASNSMYTILGVV